MRDTKKMTKLELRLLCKGLERRLAFSNESLHLVLKENEFLKHRTLWERIIDKQFT